MKINFNKPYLTGNETKYIEKAVSLGKISGNGIFTKKCQHHFEESYGFKKCLLTTSCTDALEMAAILIDIQPGDEVIVPSFTFVSTANAFILRGANIIFADSRSDHPNIDENSIERLITSRTKAIVVVHYAGVSCDMESIMKIAEENSLFVIEDAAQAIDSYYGDRALGGIGHLGTFSFHETKNVISGEGGMLVINDERFLKRAEIIWEKGTNRTAFFRGDIDKYGWVDIGSSFLPSDLNAAFLFAQLEKIEDIQKKRKDLWNHYFKCLTPLAQDKKIELPVTVEKSSNNAHMFYILCKSLKQRTDLIEFLADQEIKAVFHYLPLHKSDFYRERYSGSELPNSERYANTLLRLPLYYELSTLEIDEICRAIEEFLALNEQIL